MAWPFSPAGKDELFHEHDKLLFAKRPEWGLAVAQNSCHVSWKFLMCNFWVQAGQVTQHYRWHAWSGDTCLFHSSLSSLRMPLSLVPSFVGRSVFFSLLPHLFLRYSACGRSHFRCCPWKQRQQSPAWCNGFCIEVFGSLCWEVDKVTQGLAANMALLEGTREDSAVLSGLMSGVNYFGSVVKAKQAAQAAHAKHVSWDWLSSNDDKGQSKEQKLATTLPPRPWGPRRASLQTLQHQQKWNHERDCRLPDGDDPDYDK